MHPHPRRPAKANLPWLAFLGSVGLFAALVALLGRGTIAGWFAATPTARRLVVFCAAGLREPVQEAARLYQDETGVEVQLNYRGSNSLLSDLQHGEAADLFLPADDDYVRLARERGLIDEVFPLATMRPVLAVARGNPLKVASLDDLIRRGLRVSQANPEAAAVGRVSRDALLAVGKWDGFAKCIKVTKPTVNDVAADLRLGAVDAAVIWDALAKQYGDVDVVPVPALEKALATISACVVRTTKQPTAALRFARWLAAKDRGLPVFAASHYRTAEGDAWAEAPTLTLYGGSMLRGPIDKTVSAFEEREGVVVKRVYNGCGVLVSQMSTSGLPDVYFACDRSFLDKPSSKDAKVKSIIERLSARFDPPVVVSGNQLVILVHKGNPKGIRKLRDLGKPGVRVGVGHEKECAMGLLTAMTLEEDRSTDPVMKNVKVVSVTGDVLVAQLRYGSLDAVVAYISNAAGSGDELESIAIDIPCAFAEQPYAVSRESEHRHTARRLLDAIRAEESLQRFDAFGFTRGGAPAAAKGKP